MCDRVLAIAAIAVDIGGCRTRVSGPRPIIHRIAPKLTGPGFSPAGIEHRQCRLIGEYLVRRQYRAEHQLIQRRQPPARASHPGAERRAVERDALPLEHLCLAVERQRVTELADHHMRHQRFRRHAAIDRPLRRGRLHHSALAGAAPITRPAHQLHAQLGRNQVEHLGAIVTDHVQRTATAGAFLALDVDDDLVARQVRGQRTAIAVGCRYRTPSLRWLCCLFGGVVRGGTLLLILQDELQLLEVELFRARPVAVAQQALDELP